MRLSVSLVVTDLIMDSSETNVISKCSFSPKIWLSYFENTFFITKRDGLDKLFDHVNNMSDGIKFTRYGI